MNLVEHILTRAAKTSTTPAPQLCSLEVEQDWHSLRECTP